MSNDKVISMDKAKRQQRMKVIKAEAKRLYQKKQDGTLKHKMCKWSDLDKLIEQDESQNPSDK